MSEYQFYRFERVHGYLTTRQCQALRAVSSRAEITANAFQVYYNYSGLKAEPSQIMLDNFDIGFYYADWGSLDVYIKIPAGTIPKALTAFETEGLYVYETETWQLLIFSLNEYEEYFDEEDAENFFQHITGLYDDLMQGRWQLVYFMWLKALAEHEDPADIPLFNLDFADISDEQRAFAELFSVPLASAKAVELALTKLPSHQVETAQFHVDEWLNSLTEADKNKLLRSVFEQGSLTSQQAIALTTPPNKDKVESFQHWLTPNTLKPFAEQAKIQFESEQAEVLKQRLAQEKAQKEKALNEIYSQQSTYWKQAQEQANRTCYTGYNQASHLLHQLAEAYQFAGEDSLFEQSLKRYLKTNRQRKALLDRLKSII